MSDAAPTQTAADRPCLWCDEPFDDPAEQTVATMTARLHLCCLQRSVVGGVNHLMGRCVCCGGTQPPDPPGMSRRHAARMASHYFRVHPVIKLPIAW